MRQHTKIEEGIPSVALKGRYIIRIKKISFTTGPNEAKYEGGRRHSIPSPERVIYNKNGKA